MKKFLVAFLSLVCVFACVAGLAACGIGGKPNGGEQENPSQTGEYTVVYDANGGQFDKGDIELDDDVTLDDGTVVSADGTKMTLTTKQKELMPPLKTPERARYVFTGWAKDRDGENLWDFENDKLSGNITLYAVWTVTFDYKPSEDKSYYIVRGIGGLSGDVEIPETHNGKPVKEIAENAFKGENTLTSIIIPDSVIKIGKAAFMRCNNLLSVTIGEGVAELPEQLFSECGKLEKILIPKSVIKFDERSFGEFGELSALTEVHYSGTADDWCNIEMKEYILLNQNINEPANPLANGKAKLFIDGQAATDITINTARINKYAFYKCGTINSVTIGSKVTEIGTKAFYFNSNLKSLNFASDSKLITVSESAFERTGILSLALPANMQTVQTNAFGSCMSLTSVQLGGTKYVYDRAFAGCDSLKTLDLGKAEELGSSAFGSCSLTSVTIPDTVWYMEGSFSLNSQLNSVTFASNASSASWQVTTVKTTGQETATVTSDSLTNLAQNAKRIKENGIWLRIAGTLTYQEINNGKEYEVTGVENKNGTGVLAIPAKYNDKPVTSISSSAFYGFSGLKIISIPDSVTSIDSSAFSGCNSLTSIIVAANNTHYASQDGILYNRAKTKFIYIPKVKGAITIPDGITAIGSSAFADCSRLTSITIPDSVANIGYGAFRNCTALELMVLPFGGVSSNDKAQYTHFGFAFGAQLYSDIKKYVPSSLKTIIITGGTRIAQDAFYNFSGLTNITIPNSVTSIDDNAFRNCSSLTSITIPDSVTSIGEYAFADCSGLTSITIGNSVTSIGRSAFNSCSSLTSITIPDSVTSIGDYAFSGCSSLTSITIPDSVTSIDDNTFYKCSSLTSITIGNGVTSIGDSAFEDCSSLTSITIPNSVTSIGGSAFSGCNNLRYNEYDNAFYLGNNTNPYLVLIKAKDTSILSCTINTNTKIIYSSAFYNCSSLSSITIPDSVTSIGDTAFYQCSSLTSVIIGNSVTSIGEDVFGFCSSLSSITIPNSVTSIGDNAFYNCSDLTSVIIGNSVTSIGRYAFYNCVSIINITIPDSVTSIGDYAFGNCGSLTSIIIPNSVTSIGDYAFENCGSLTSITIPDSVASIGSCAFSGCSSLTSVNIGNGVTSIGSYAFSGCSSLTSITIPDGVTGIGHGAFYDCSSLTSIIIPNSVNGIGWNAFEDCGSLTSITFNGTMAQWNAITKGDDWNLNTGDYTVHCTDGDIAKEN